MIIDYVASVAGDAQRLAELRVRAMKPSLEAVGRFDPLVARRRFLDDFTPESCVMLYRQGELIGFYVLHRCEDHLFLAHLYIEPEQQCEGIGGAVMRKVKAAAQECALPIRLGALRDSLSNEFYCQHGFIKTHEDEWDIYYQWPCSPLFDP